jgi:hypothetical protein
VRLLARERDHSKKAQDLIGIGNVAGTIILTMSHDKLTELFTTCSIKNITKSWSGLIAVVAAGYSYLESSEGKRHRGGEGPILRAIRAAIQDWDPTFQPMLAEYFHFIDHGKQQGASGPADLSAVFVAFAFQRHPLASPDLKPILEDAEVMAIINGVIASQFKNYWE